MTSGPLLELNNDVDRPAPGLGVLQSPRDETVGAVRDAIAAGYRLIDTAAVWRNEAEVGQGIVQSGIDRSELFVTTKAWISDYGFDQTLHAFDRSMRKLGIVTQAWSPIGGVKRYRAKDGRSPRTRCSTPSSLPLRRSTARPPPRSCCAGISTMATRPFRNRSASRGSPRTSMSSTSR